LTYITGLRRHFLAGWIARGTCAEPQTALKPILPRRPDTRTVKVEVTDSRLARTVTGSMVVNGRRVMVQRRAAFAISSGYQPVKKR
jgi:hypothetical protein